MLIIGLALGAISVAAIRLAKIRPFLLVGWCWYLGTLVPVIGLVQVGVQSMADRYTYIPLIGIFIIAAWGAAEFTEDWPARNKAVAAAVVLAALRMVRVAAGGDLVQQRGPVPQCRGGRALQFLRAARTRHGLLEGRKAGRGAEGNSRPS